MYEGSWTFTYTGTEAAAVAYAPGMRTGSQAQSVPQARKVWRSCPHRAHGMSRERCTLLVWTVSHTGWPSCVVLRSWVGFEATQASDGSNCRLSCRDKAQKRACNRRPGAVLPDLGPEQAATPL